MKHVSRTFAALSLLLLLVSVAPAQTRKPRIKYYSIHTNQTFHVRMNDSLKSDESHVGETFSTTVVDPVYSTNGIELVPSGSIIHGRVTAVQKARKDGNPGTLSVSFYSVRLPNSRSAAMSGSLTDLDTGNTKSDNEGTASAKQTSKRNVKFIGGGAGGKAAAGGALPVLVQAAMPSAMRPMQDRTFTRIAINPPQASTFEDRPDWLGLDASIGGPCPQGFLEKPLHVGLEGLP